MITYNYNDDSKAYAEAIIMLHELYQLYRDRLCWKTEEMEEIEIEQIDEDVVREMIE